MYAMYLRKSRADVEAEALGEMETLARHEKILTELAKRKGIKICEVYKEIVSGESIENRPEMQRLLKDVYARKYKGVLVVELERLARGDTKDQGTVAEAFKLSNTMIITPMKDYDPNNEFDEEYLEFGLFMSRREYKTISRRMQQGIIQSVKEGNYVGSLPPYGYDIVKRGKRDRTLKLNDQSQYVELIFDWFVNDRMNAGAIASKLTSMGVPTRTGKPEWHRATIKDILKNRLYTGRIEWFKRKTSKEFDENGLKRTKRRQTPEDHLIVEGKHPAIIDDEMFQKAQRLFEGNVPIKAMSTITNPLAGIAVCKKCGKKMIRQGYDKFEGRKAPRLLHPESKLCKVKSMPFDDVMDAIIINLNAHIEEFEFKMNNGGELQQAEKQRRLIESLEKELETLNAQRSKLFDYLERKIYTEDEFLERKALLTERIKAVSETIENERTTVVDEVDYQERIVRFSEVVESLRNPNIPAKIKNELLKDIIERIEYGCIDLGRQKGGIIELDIYLKD